ncbi:hypothetical protein [Nocardia sp. CC227C]|uniref:hypothetical protein n=1 Tax=Nocardia sp. CC227C TaxID=3044562 RepID=UPI00278C2F73|nr:hypothetical protein [Nocardia sp. CC227C]
MAEMTRIRMLTAMFGLVALVFAVGGCGSDSETDPEPQTRDVYVEDLLGQTWDAADKLTGSDVAPPYSVLRTINVLELPGAPKADPAPPMYDKSAYVVVAACFYKPNPATATTAPNTVVTQPPMTVRPPVTEIPFESPTVPSFAPSPSLDYNYDNRVVLGITPRAAATPDIIDRAKQLQFQGLITPGYDCQDATIPIKVPIS